MHATENKNRDLAPLLKAARLFPPAGGVFLVGGCVRDLLIGEQPADYDLAVSGQPESYAEKLARKHGGRPIALGPSRHRIFRVVAGKRVFDVSPLAGDAITADLQNRDFTFNAMAFDLSGQVLIDPADGLGDLENRVVRMVSPTALADDPLRQLRAFRLAAQLGGRIDPQTLDAITTAASAIATCAGERIRAELLKLFAASNSADILAQMAESGLLHAVVPELLPLKDCQQNTHHSFDVWTHTLAAYRHLEATVATNTRIESKALTGRAVSTIHESGRTGLLKMALLLHDVGKPATRSVDRQGQIHFYGHGRRGAFVSAAVCRRLKFSRRETDYISTIIKSHNRPLFLFLLNAENKLSNRAVTRFFIQCGKITPDILLHATADFAGKRPTPEADSTAFNGFAETLLDRYYDTHAQRAALPGLLTGHDLASVFSLPPSPLYKKILARVETARLAGEISDKNQALALVRRLLEGVDLP